MKQIFQNKIIRVLKKTLFMALLFFAGTFIEIYWSMGEFSERMSSGCIDCSFIEDVYFISLLTSVFLTIVFLLLSLLKKIYLKNTIELLLLSSIWGFWNYTVFVERESSWSTYTFKEEFFCTFSLSILPVLTLSIATIFSINYISRISKT
ncbi:hypothetical protein [Flavobacterium sp. N502540]|uniref:hypothetical protein n=1 Tax=Flavobacterium sp. N502540 TaxID=2986838 RepID=UPI002224ACA7|nr:hypothetical protein [Flavobacterium sp. N502540]